MKTFIRIVLYVAALASVSAHAERPASEFIENSVETQAKLISVPSAVGGMVTLSACTECPSRALRLANDFRPMVDGKTATLDQLRARLSSLGEAPVGVYYRIQDNLITRITGPGL